MKNFLIISLLIISKLIFGQDFDKNVETENIMNFLLQQDSISRIVFDMPENITDYQFDGDYTADRIYPNTPKNVIVCTVPITFESSAHSILKEIDLSYDSSYYQKQIRESNQNSWKEKKLKLDKKIKFIKWKWRMLYKEINSFSIPLFSKDGHIALVKFSSLNGRSIHKKRPQILILKRNNNNWKIIAKINSIKNW